VSITLTSKADVLEVVDAFSDLPPAGMLPASGGGGSDFPPAGISPAKIEVDTTHMSASVIAIRFIDFAPLRLRKCRSFYIKKNGTTTRDLLQGRLERTNIPLHSLNFSLIESLNSHADDLSEVGYFSP
jgi:hypothetical protein